MKRTIVAIGVLLLFLLAGCLGGGSSSGGGEKDYQVSGKVTIKDTGEGLAGANIVYPSGKTKTNEDGSWTLTNLTGSVKIEVQKEGWQFRPPSTTVNKTRQDVNFIAEKADNTIIDPDAFADPALETAIREKVGKPTEELTQADLNTIVSLAIYDLGSGNLGGIELLSNLERLHMSRGILTDFDSFTKLPALRSLTLNYLQITDISGLSELVDLIQLEVTCNNVSDIEPLKGLTKLERLVLWQNKIVDLEPLKELSNLNYLRLWDNQIADLKPLKDLKNLTYLDVCKNPISNINVLADLTELTFLNLEETKITSIAPLSNLTALEHLYIGDIPNLKFDTTTLKKLPNLTNLSVGGHLSSQNIQVIAEMDKLIEVRILNSQEPLEIKPLGSLPNLHMLTIRRANVSDLESLSNFTLLRSLTITNAGFSDLNPIAQLTQLESLNLFDNGIEDLNPLINLVNLKDFYLWWNNISDISPLLKNEGLGHDTRLNLTNNPLSEQAFKDIVTLENRGVTVVYDPSSPTGFSMEHSYDDELYWNVYERVENF